MLVQVGRFAAYAVRLRFRSCAIAHGVQPDRPSRYSPVAQSAEHAPLKRGVDGANPSRAAISRPCSPTQRQPPQKRSSAGASPAMGTIYASVAQPTEHRASNAEVEGASPSGNTISSRNVNRTSEPGLGANEIVPPPRGMGSMSSAFRQFS